MTVTRFFCFFFFLVVASSSELSAATVALAWDANTETNLAGYRIYVNGDTDWVVDAGLETTLSLTNLNAGETYEFYATAYNTAGLESEPSNSIIYTVPFPKPDLVEGFPPASPEFTKTSWTREFSGQNGLWLVELAWLPVTNATGYLVIREQFSVNDASSEPLAVTNFQTGTNYSATLNFGLYKISVQSSNEHGLSPRDTYVFSPPVPGKVVGLRVVNTR